MLQYNLTPGADGTSGGDAATTMIARYVNTVPPSVIDFQYMSFDLSSITAKEVIVKIELRLDELTYTATKGLSKIFSIWHYDNPTPGTTITVLLSSIVWAAGATYHDITTVGLTVFTKDANNEIRIYVPDPGDTNTRVMTGYTTEYATEGSRPQLRVTTTIGRVYIIEAG